jgi:hypothetical protein
MLVKKLIWFNFKTNRFIELCATNIRGSLTLADNKKKNKLGSFINHSTGTGTVYI